MHAARRLILVLCCLTLALTGCDRRAIKPGTYEVDLKVYAIVGTGEFLGDPSNNGCRLSEAAIGRIVNQAITNGSVFGNNTKLQWDGTVDVIIDPHASTYERNGTTGDFLNVLLNFGVPLPSPSNQPASINIYFSGNFGPSNGQVFGAALDPRLARDAADSNPLLENLRPGYIRINDGGGRFGVSSDEPELRSRITLEHELAHYFARFYGRTFGSGDSARTYDSGEHVASGANLLLAGPAVDKEGRQLVIPGRQRNDSDAGADELGEISTRIFQGLWNSP